MSNNRIEQLENKVKELTDVVDMLTKVVSKININSDKYLLKDRGVQAGFATKVGFNSDGVIVNTDKLNSSDIPELPITKIKDLMDKLNTKVDMKSYEGLKEQLESLAIKGKVVETATKVNIDSNGKVVGTAKLLATDIPTLSIDKIENLKATLDSISQMKPLVDDDTIIEPGIACKVSFNEKGKIIDVLPLRYEDLPKEVNTKFNKLNEMIINTSTKDEYNTLRNELANKVNSNNDITPGTYCKVDVDEKGLITNGYELSSDDLPIIPISKIDNLSTLLTSKCDKKDFNEMVNSVNQLIEIVTKLQSDERLGFQNQWIANNEDSKVNEDINGMKDQITSLTNLVEKLSNNEDINLAIGSLEKRLVNLESICDILNKRSL